MQLQLFYVNTIQNDITYFNNYYTLLLVNIFNFIRLIHIEVKLFSSLKTFVTENNVKSFCQ